MSKIYYFNELEDFFGDDQWKLQIDVTDLWNKYNEGKIDIQSFNAQYAKRLSDYKGEVTELGDDVWSELGLLIEKMSTNNDEKELLSIYDKIYNWADKNDVLIKTN